MIHDSSADVDHCFCLIIRRLINCTVRTKVCTNNNVCYIVIPTFSSTERGMSHTVRRINGATELIRFSNFEVFIIKIIEAHHIIVHISEELISTFLVIELTRLQVFQRVLKYFPTKTKIVVTVNSGSKRTIRSSSLFHRLSNVFSRSRCYFSDINCSR